jgi:hypothetical protein
LGTSIEGQVISPSAVARVECLASRRHLPATTNAFGTAEMKSFHQVDFAIT